MATVFPPRCFSLSMRANPGFKWTSTCSKFLLVSFLGFVRDGNGRVHIPAVLLELNIDSLLFVNKRAPIKIYVMRTTHSDIYGSAWRKHDCIVYVLSFLQFIRNSSLL